MTISNYACQSQIIILIYSGVGTHDLLYDAVRRLTAIDQPGEPDRT